MWGCYPLIILYTGHKTLSSVSSKAKMNSLQCGGSGKCFIVHVLGTCTLVMCLSCLHPAAPIQIFLLGMWHDMYAAFTAVKENRLHTVTQTNRYCILYTGGACIPTRPAWPQVGRRALSLHCAIHTFSCRLALISMWLTGYTVWSEEQTLFQNCCHMDWRMGRVAQ